MILGFDLKERFKGMIRGEEKIPAEYFDLGVAFWMLNPDEEAYTPEHLSAQYLHKKKGTDQELYRFAAKKLKEYKLEKLFYEVEMPLLRILAEMEVRGIQIDPPGLKKLDAELTKRIEALVKNIYAKAGEAFNINSPRQLGSVLFEKMKIGSAGVKKTPGGAVSTNAETLMKIKARHPIIEFILEYRELFKLQSTYVSPLGQLADVRHRVHTTYIQTGTSTGRLSSRDPNLQNIPAEGPWAKKIRAVFVAEKGFQLASFDYSQIELRVLASLAGDPKMIDAFNHGADIHRLTAANVFNVPAEKVTPEMRRLAKTLNFGVVYGMGVIAFSKTSGLPFGEARKFIDEYFHDFARVKEWQETVKEQARKFGYVTNANGRRRWLLHAVSMFRGEAAEAERAAINMPVQGLAADILKMAMIRVDEEIRKRGWSESVRMLLTIHDELIFEIQQSMLDDALRVIRSAMEGAYELEVPIVVAEKKGENWGALA